MSIDGDASVLVGCHVWTVDHVRRQVVEVDSPKWTDEYGVTTDLDDISRVIINGQPQYPEYAIGVLSGGRLARSPQGEAAPDA